MDKLDEVFARQKELMETFHAIEEARGLLPDPDVPVDLTTHEGQAVLRSYAWYITEELGEAMNLLKNRPWKQKTYPVEVYKFYEELADAFHFFVELCILSGLSADDLYLLYIGKANVNQTRQMEGV
jgi:hypothetical protein